MRRVVKSLLGVLVIALPVFAGALTLEVGNPLTNPEAQSKNAVLLARTTACHSPEKSKLTATAEGFVNGVRRSIPLQLIPLSMAGTFVVTREWPSSDYPRKTGTTRPLRSSDYPRKTGTTRPLRFTVYPRKTGTNRPLRLTGKWAVRIVATNPEYKNYATGVLVPFDGNSVEWTSIKHYFHEPTGEELASLLNGHSDGGGTSIK